MDEPDIDECFRLLKLKRGADLAKVKRAYRANLYKCHPDRFQNQPEMLPVAEKTTKRLIAVYGVLEKWYARNGGADPGSSTAPAWQTAEPEEPEWEEDDAEPAGSPLFGAWAAAAVLAVVLGILGWMVFSQSKDQPVPPRPAVAAIPSEVPKAVAPEPEPLLPPAGADPETRAAQLRALTDLQRAAKEAWVADYLRSREAGRIRAEAEFRDAQAGYQRDVTAMASEIEAALKERDRQIEVARRDSDAARVRFLESEREKAEAMRRDYDRWLLSEGTEAVALVSAIRDREHFDIGVLSNTEDPRKIFEFWMPNEAGAPEINIAAKTGITVLLPDGRYFPHFRSNIHLYGEEGRELVEMMESVVRRRDALLGHLEDEKRSGDAEVADWDLRHPLGPIALPDALQSVLVKRDAAEGRLAEARVRLEEASRTVDAIGAGRAFDQSGEGRRWADRILEAQAGADNLTP
jgi:hypothetical protein